MSVQGRTLNWIWWWVSSLGAYGTQSSFLSPLFPGPSMGQIQLFKHLLRIIVISSYGNQTWPIKWNAVSSRQRSYRYCCMDALLGHTPQGTNYTATCLPSRKLSKLEEPDMQDTAGEAGTSSLGMYSWWTSTYMAGQKHDDQLEHTYSSYVRIRDVALRPARGDER